VSLHCYSQVSHADNASQTPPAAEGSAPAQSDSQDSSAPHHEPEVWNVFYQATSIGQYHGRFRSPYQGFYSLQDAPERDVSLTSTLFFGLRLGGSAALYCNPEIAGGRGFSGVAGIANFPNGEMPRVATATPKPYLARLYVTHDFGFGTAAEVQESGANQLAGSRPAVRYSITAGRFTVTDFFDNNRYSHDPRTQFMGWGVMYNGAWDYAADTRGYTWAWMHELHTPAGSVRYASVAMPKVANGLRFDRRLLRDRADVVEAEVRRKWRGRDGALRLLGYRNAANAGDYALAIQTSGGAPPDVTKTRRIGTAKYGFGVNGEYEAASGICVFGRYGWNDGQTESFAFTAIDRLLTAGVSVSGARWKRAHDTAAAEITSCGISGIHADYLASGGLDFIIGDGRLHYGRETVAEAYYSARMLAPLTVTFDLQHVTNPAYNRDRGPVWIFAMRLHVEGGKR